MNTVPPNADQLDHLLGTADRRRLTVEEAALLRAGVRHLAAQLTAAEAAVETNREIAHVLRAALDRVTALADRWDNALATDKPHARALRDTLAARTPTPLEPRMPGIYDDGDTYGPSTAARATLSAAAISRQLRQAGFTRSVSTGDGSGTCTRGFISLQDSPWRVEVCVRPQSRADLQAQTDRHEAALRSLGYVTEQHRAQYTGAPLFIRTTKAAGEGR
ncbi:hypothetical protein [Kitasatospora sp. NPDC056184]|uniref:hypothetical protein n=1 Tax=Kitasatospora sp. NPDC056184 TaxID=3345738 RepID=UPI0035E26D6C